MKPFLLHKQVLRTTHTPAICDSEYQPLGTRTNAGLARSTAPNKAVHARGPLAGPPSDGATSCKRSRQ